MTINIGNNLSYLICLLLLIPGVYGQYSVFKYFGINKAFGYDHFDPEKFKHTPFVSKGIFKYTPNGMYTFVFLLLWIPGVLFQSKAALLAALFQHIYIWIHYYFTELPDIKFISININADKLTMWKRLLYQHNFSLDGEYRFRDPEAAKKILAIQYINKVMVISQNNQIITSNANMFSNEFKGLLNEL